MVTGSGKSRYGGPVAKDTVSQVRHVLATSPHGRAIALVEGPSDVRAYKRHLAQSPWSCMESDAANKDGVLRTMQDLRRQGMSGVVGIVDSDCDRLLPWGAQSLPEDVFATDTHDLETLALKCGAADEAVRLWRKWSGDSGLLSEYREPPEEGLLHAVAPLGRLKLLGQLGKVRGRVGYRHWGICFDDLLEGEVVSTHKVAREKVLYDALHDLKPGEFVCARVRRHVGDEWWVTVGRRASGKSVEVPGTLPDAELGPLFRPDDIVEGAGVRARVLRIGADGEIHLTLHTGEPVHSGECKIGLPDGAGGVVLADGSRLPLWGSAAPSVSRRHVVVEVLEGEDGLRARSLRVHPSLRDRVTCPHPFAGGSGYPRPSGGRTLDDATEEMAALIDEGRPWSLEELELLCRGHDVAELIAARLKGVKFGANAPEMDRARVEHSLCVEYFSHEMFRSTELCAALEAWEQKSGRHVLKH